VAPVHRSRVIVTCGLGYGDEGKGSMVDFLTRRTGASLVLRYSGGPQAAHYVTESSGRSHCFSQFGSGTLVAGVKTHLCSTMLIKPQNLLAEHEELCRKGITDALMRLSLSPECQVVTPYHAMMGQLREMARGSDRFGSVGMGVGEAVRDAAGHGEGALRVKDFFSPRALSRKLKHLRDVKCQEALTLTEGHGDQEMSSLLRRFQPLSVMKRLVEDCRDFVTALPLTFSDDDQVVRKSLQIGGKMIFEGSQGSLIDGDYGFWPYVTKTSTTVKPARQLLSRHGMADGAFYLGILRAYSYRHGPGPLVPEETALAGLFPEQHNRKSRWQGDIRAGWFDLPASRYAVGINGHLDGLAVTHLDSIGAAGMVKICLAYCYTGESIEEMERYFVPGGPDGRKITMFRPFCNNGSPDRSQALFLCRPMDFLEFSGAPPVSRLECTPWMKHFLHFLESREGLALPVAVLSHGPVAEDKILSGKDLKGDIQ